MDRCFQCRGEGVLMFMVSHLRDGLSARFCSARCIYLWIQQYFPGAVADAEKIAKAKTA